MRTLNSKKPKILKMYNNLVLILNKNNHHNYPSRLKNPDSNNNSNKIQLNNNRIFP